MEQITITPAEAAGVQDLEADGVKMLTHEQVQKALGVCESTIDRLIASKKLPAMKVGRHWRIPIAGYKKYVAQQMKASN